MDTWTEKELKINYGLAGACFVLALVCWGFSGSSSVHVDYAATLKHGAAVLVGIAAFWGFGSYLKWTLQ